MRKKPPVERLEVPIRELQDLLGEAREKLGADGYRKLKAAIDTLEYLTRLIEDQKTTIQNLRDLLAKPGSTEKTDKVLANAGLKSEARNSSNDNKAKKTKGHGRNGAQAFTAGRSVPVTHAALMSGALVRSAWREHCMHSAIPALCCASQAALPRNHRLRTPKVALRSVSGSVHRAGAAASGRSEIR